MKGPHFFEKRKKEMAKAQKAKEKADRKAQRKAGGGKLEGDELLDEDGLPIGLEGQVDGESEASEGGASEGGEGAGVGGVTGVGRVTGVGLTKENGATASGDQRQPQADHVAPPAAGAFRGNPGG